MSASITAARSTLSAALVAASLRCSDSPGDTAPPVVHIFGNGVPDMGHIVRGQVEYEFRLVLQPEGGTPAVSSINLGVMAEAVVVVLRNLAGFRVGPVSPDVMRTIGGSDFLSVDITTSTMIDL